MLPHRGLLPQPGGGILCYLASLLTTRRFPRPAYSRMLSGALHLDALALLTRPRLLALREMAVRLAQRRCPSPLPAAPGGAPPVYREASFPLIALVRTLWRLSYRETHDWLVAWPALAVAYLLAPLDTHECLAQRNSPSRTAFLPGPDWSPGALAGIGWLSG